MKKTKNGFTLIELLVVVTIMSILTIITVSQFMTARSKARDVARKGDLNAVSKALLMYYNDYGVFPYSFKGMISLTADGSGSNSVKQWGYEFSDAATPAYTYMKVLPIENTAGRLPYCYVVTGDRKSFALYASLESTQDVECSGAYRCEGQGPYCYTVVSPNATKGDAQLQN